MILVRRGLFFVLAVLVCLAALGAGVLGYVSVQTTAAGTAEHARFVAERFLFISLAAAVFFCLVFLFIVLRSIRIDRELDKIIELNRFQDFSPEKSMKRLGLIGRKITDLYYQLNNLNEKKSLKISAQGELVTFLVNNLDLPLAVCDVTGIVLWVSSSFPDKLGKTRTEVIGGRIDAMLQDVSTPNILFELGRSHASLEKVSGKLTVTCYPVHNRMNELSYVTFVLGKKAVFSETEAKPSDQLQPAQPSRLQKAFHRLLNRRK